MGNWIDATIGLPVKFNDKGDSINCIVCDIEAPTSGTAWYNYETENWTLIHFSTGNIPIKVTHWKPLGELPK